MIPFDEITRSLQGAWALFMGDCDGMNGFNLSFEGLIRSFLLIIYLLPALCLFALAEWNDFVQEYGSLSQVSFVIGTAVQFTIDWLLFPLLMIPVSRLINGGKTYVAYIVSVNWAGAIALLPLGVPALFYSLGIIPELLFAILTLIGLGLVLRYFWFLAVTALGVNGITAVALVLTQLVISVTASELTRPIKLVGSTAL